MDVREVIHEAVRRAEQGDPYVLVTVVRTKGSTPQKPGAKLLARQDGTAAGTLGGGCVEGDIWFAARQILRQQGGPEYKDYLLNEEIAARDGLVCGGTMYFLLDPVYDAESFAPFGRALLDAYEGGQAVALATVVRSADDPGLVGRKLLWRRDGSILGGLGSPDLDQAAVAAAREVAELGRNRYLEGVAGCDLFVEGFTTPPTLVLLGGGHIAKAVAPLARSVGFRVYVVDDRPQFANKERFPEAEDAIVADFVEGLSQVPVNANTFIVVATRGHRHDDLALEAAARTPARYVGLVGSRRKTILIYKELLQRGIPEDRLRDLHAPIGLDIGALTPEQIAVSIVAEVIMVQMGGQGGLMRLGDAHFERLRSQATLTGATS